MNFKFNRGALCGFCMITVLAFTTEFASAQPQTTKSATMTGSTSSTREVSGTVLAVDGNTLLVKMSTGEVRTIVASDSQRALINGREVAARDLQVGTKLKATITTTTTSLIERTTTVGSGKVWYVAAPNVILTLPNGENRQYKVKDDYKFTVDGRPATVFELRKGMTVSAEKIVEEPKTVLSSNSVVTGELPAAPVRAEAPAPAPRPTPTPTPTPAAAPAPAPRPAPVAKAAPAPEPEKAAPPAKLPKTGSLLPLIGLMGALLTSSGLGLISLRRRK